MIVVGSKNPVKVSAVAEVFADYPQYATMQVSGVDASSGVRPQPLSLEETVSGARNRARQAYEGFLGVGLESGIMAIPDGYLEVCFAAIFDGTRMHTGMSCGFALPKAVTNLMFEEELNLVEAAMRVGLTDDPEVGKKGGLLSILTDGRLTRKEYSKQSLITAIISLEHL